MLRLGVGQFNPKVTKVKENLSGVRKLLQQAATNTVDVLVLPELSNSGYVFETENEVLSSAEEIPIGNLSIELLEWSEAGRMVIAGICEKSEKGLFNSAAVFADGKHITTYRKIHLFLNEKSWFAAGDTEPPVVDFSGYRVGVMICYDWAFPEIARILTLKGAQVIVHPSNLVLPYCQDAMITRSIENRVYTATANRNGIERNVEFSGNSQITSPLGQRLASLDSKETGVTWADIDPTTADDKMVTKRNHLLDDRRPEVYTRLIRNE